MKSQMKGSDRSGAMFAVIVGTDELAAGTVVVRPLRAERGTDTDQQPGESRHGGQAAVPRTDLIPYLKKAMS